MERASSEARKRMALAMAPGGTHREKSALGIACRLPGVSMVLGSTAFTVMPSCFTSSARDSVRMMTPALAAE